LQIFRCAVVAAVVMPREVRGLGGNLEVTRVQFQLVEECPPLIREWQDYGLIGCRIRRVGQIHADNA